MASWRGMWWTHADAFARDARRADDDLLREMHRWARAREADADAPGRGRNAKARRHFADLRRLAVLEIERRGLR